jgi:hypothetical protein
MTDRKRTAANTRLSTLAKILLLCLCVASCQDGDNQSTLHIGKGKDGTVSLNILDAKGITKIEFTSKGDYQSVIALELAPYKNIDYGFNGKGEGTLQVIVYSAFDTIRSAHYVEGGYHVNLACDATHIKTLEHTGY